MRGHWESQTRKLNRHYQSGNGGRRLRVIRSGVIASSYIMSDFPGATNQGYMGLWRIISDFQTNRYSIIQSGENVGEHYPSEIIRDSGWYGLKYRIDDLLYANSQDTEYLYEPWYFEQRGGEYIFGIRSYNLDYHTPTNVLLNKVICKSRLETNVSSDININPSVTYQTVAPDPIPFTPIHAIGVGIQENRSSDTIESIENNISRFGAFYFYVPDMAVEPEYLFPAYPKLNDVHFRYKKNGFTFWEPVVKGEAWIEKYNMSPFEARQ